MKREKVSARVPRRRWWAAAGGRPTGQDVEAYPGARRQGDAGSGSPPGRSGVPAAGIALPPEDGAGFQSREEARGSPPGASRPYQTWIAACGFPIGFAGSLDPDEVFRSSWANSIALAAGPAPGEETKAPWWHRRHGTRTHPPQTRLRHAQGLPAPSSARAGHGQRRPRADPFADFATRRAVVFTVDGVARPSPGNSPPSCYTSRWITNARVNPTHHPGADPATGASGA